MPTLQVNTSSFDFPDNGELGGQGWGEEVSGWAEAITNKINGISSNYEILISSATINNNISSDTAISGLSFNSSLVRAAQIYYTITRTTREYGILNVIYNGSSWDISQDSVIGDAGILFNVNSSGQVLYQSTNDIAGTVKFASRSLIEP